MNEDAVRAAAQVRIGALVTLAHGAIFAAMGLGIVNRQNERRLARQELQHDDKRGRAGLLRVNDVRLERVDGSCELPAVGNGVVTAVARRLKTRSTRSRRRESRSGSSSDSAGP